MKFTASLLILAVVASQALGAVPAPVKQCTKTVTVATKPTTKGCSELAKANDITVAELRKWNNKLRHDCANVEVGTTLCVAVAKPTITAHAKPTTTATHHGNATLHHGNATIHHGNATIHHGNATLHHSNGTRHHGNGTFHHGNGTFHHHGNGTFHHGNGTFHHGNGTSHRANTTTLTQA
ncbi:hypothetical protein BGX21_000055 [Mortierella sp. AD011]|nr:hypothetical protein BGX21_000055 [Mortierella sp. AD011]